MLLNSDRLPDLTVSMNDSQAQLGLRSGEQVAGESLLVTLKGQPGNPSAVGTVATLELHGGCMLCWSKGCSRQ